MSSNLLQYGAPINAGQAHLLSNNTWPYKAFIRPTGREAGFKKIPPIALSRAMERDLAGIGKKIVVLKDGGLLLEVASAEMLGKLLTMTPLVVCGIPCFSYTPDDMVTVKGVIHNIPLDLNPEELIQSLEAQGYPQKIFIMQASRIKNRFGNPTPVVALTFFGKVLPECVRVHNTHCYIQVEPYIIPPLRCFKCQDFGHTSNRCPNIESCARCAAHHNTRNCSSIVICCTNCGGGHTSRSPRCPVYLWASKVQKYKYHHGCSWSRAEAMCGDRPQFFATPSLAVSEIQKSSVSPPTPSPSQSSKFTLEVNQTNQVKAPQYINKNKTKEIPNTKIEVPEVTTCKDSKTFSELRTVEKNFTPSVSPIKETIDPTVKSDILGSSSLINSSSTAISTDRESRGSTPNREGGSTLTDVTDTDTSFTDDTAASTEAELDPEMRDASTQSDSSSLKHEKSTQTETYFEANFLHRFDLDKLLFNMKGLLADINIKSGKYTEIYLRNKFLASFISAFQKNIPSIETEGERVFLAENTDKPAHRATPKRVSRSLKPSSLPKPIGSRLRCLNSPLKTMAGSRRFSLGSPQTYRGVKKRIFKP